MSGTAFLKSQPKFQLLGRMRTVRSHFAAWFRRKPYETATSVAFGAISPVVSFLFAFAAGGQGLSCDSWPSHLGV